MGTRERPGEAGSMDARRLVTAIAREFRSTRIAGGWSQAFIARRAGISASQYGRLERDELDAPDIEQICRASRALGLEASIRLYPRGTRPRDAAQLRLLTEFEELLGPGLHMGREIPLPVQGDRRAWDGSVSDGQRLAFVEGETKLGDLQELARRLALKLRDDPRGTILILVVRRSVHNRRVLDEHREVLRDMLPLDGAAIARHLRAGRLPPASGIIVL